VHSLSIVLPAYNEEQNAAAAVEEVSAVARDLGIDYEIILVNDGSKDGKVVPGIQFQPGRGRNQDDDQPHDQWQSDSPPVCFHISSPSIEIYETVFGQ